MSPNTIYHLLKFYLHYIYYITNDSLPIFTHQVDKYIVNKYYGMGAPDYSAIRNSVDYEFDPSNKRFEIFKNTI